MNLCFLIGEIKNIKYEFMINKEHTSIIVMKIQLDNESIIKAIGYDEIADWCYQRIEKGDKVMIEGRINRGMECEMKEISRQQ